MQQATVSSRITPIIHDILEATCWSEQVFQSELIRRALRYNFERNPDRTELPNQIGIFDDPRDTSKSSNDSTGDGFLYDPVEEF